MQAHRDSGSTIRRRAQTASLAVTVSESHRSVSASIFTYNTHQLRPRAEITKGAWGCWLIILWLTMLENALFECDCENQWWLVRVASASTQSWIAVEKLWTTKLESSMNSSSKRFLLAKLVFKYIEVSLNARTQLEIHGIHHQCYLGSFHIENRSLSPLATGMHNLTMQDSTFVLKLMWLLTFLYGCF